MYICMNIYIYMYISVCMNINHPRTEKLVVIQLLIDDLVW